MLKFSCKGQHFSFVGLVTHFIEFASAVKTKYGQVGAYQRSKTVEQFKSPAFFKVVGVVYSDLTGRNLAFWKRSCLEEVVAHG